jgi:hypothetical protein
MKTFDVAVENAINGEHAVLVAFFELQFTSATQYYCTAGYNYFWNAQTWKGFGAIVNVEPIRETEYLEATGLRISLPAFRTDVLPDMVSLALQEKVQGRTLRMWVGFLNASYVLLAAPTLEFQGRMDTLTIDESEGTASLSLTVESRMASLLKAAPRRYTDEDQQALFPGDKFFQYMPQMKERVIVFPSREAQQQ